MKSVVLCFALAFTTTALSQNSNKCVIGRAKGAAHQCLQGYTISGYDEAIGICFNGATYRSVSFYGIPKFYEAGQNPLPRLLATVEFNCDGEVTVVCY